MKFCPWCGGSILDGAAFCVECGRNLPQTRRAEEKKALDIPAPDVPAPSAGVFEEQPDGIPYKPNHTRMADSVPTRQGEPSRCFLDDDPPTDAIASEPEDWQDDDALDDPGSFSYYDDVPADAQAEVREGPDRKLILRIAMIGCAAASVLLLAVLAMLYL